MDQGDRVKAGEPLVRLYSEELKRQAEIADAGVAAAAGRRRTPEGRQAVIDRCRRAGDAGTRPCEDWCLKRDQRQRLGQGDRGGGDGRIGRCRASAAIMEARQQLVAANNSGISPRS